MATFYSSVQEVGGLMDLRRQLRQWLVAEGLEVHAVADIVLGVDELVTNGLVAAAGDTVGIEVDVTNRSVTATVSNRGRAFVASSAEPHFDDRAEWPAWSGLAIADRLVGPVSVFSAEGRTLAMFRSGVELN